MKILLVDDIPINLKLLRVTLEAEDHTTLTASDGIEALALLGRETVDAIISDILMPNMDGFRLCHEIRMSEKLRDLPFIVYTSTYTSADDRKLAQTVGADQYLTKPATTGMLLQALGEAVAHRRGTAPAPPKAEESYVLKQYSQALVHKLQEKNEELQQSLVSEQLANDRIKEMNASLEQRVLERTTELEQSNQRLTRALSEVRELSGMLPICSYCKKIRDDKNYWQTVEHYLLRTTAAKLTHGICPECYEKQMKDFAGE